ncbi:uncharacterized protein LOC132449501 isoform X9 [Gadus macrocephalus]|uniref:uncharacterized protein LOC132449501 isoform X9 n=1 Tax=Gadus macrocephalus TaxID=80720 RepID=UPI0028CB7CBD|nr:uncharacterized protein LOC132449501 isoform X9 [Gadus macrocephalus]
MVPSPSCRDTSINDECYKPTSSDHGRTELVAGDCISLSCGALSDCSNITWLFGYNSTMTVELVDKGKVRSEYKKERVCVTKECSLEVKKMRKEDEGPYTCRSILSSGGHVDHIRYDLKLITSTRRPTTTKVKVFLTHGVANTACTSTSKPTTTPVKAPTAGVLLRVLVLLGFSVLTLVVLLRLIGWWRTRGNRAATEECIGLNSASDALPARERLGPGASDQQQHSVDMDLDWAPRGPSVVQRGGQRAVGSAQDQEDPGELSDAATYENLRAPPRCAGDTADTGVHFVTVHQLSK